MCGIAGIFDNGSPTSSESLSMRLRQMLSAMQHRGPDDRGEEKLKLPNSPTLYLGHQRLSVIEPGPGGHQPMSNNERSIWISTNSEIYNFLELKEELKPNFSFRSNSDTEVLLRSFEAWGLDCLSKLRGMFAFAIWDAPNKRLVLARDRLGIKPLYYFSSKKLFLFSSELRSIQASGLVSTSLSSSAIYQYLSFGRVGSPETILDPVLELPPGHFLIADENGVTIKEYWNAYPKDTQITSDRPVSDQIQHILEESVRLRLVSDVPLGAFLSGGIDSSAVVGMMQAHSPSPIKTLSVTFQEKKYDESEFSNWIANALGTDHQELHLSEHDLLEQLPKALAAMDQPTVDGINTYLISQAARKRGLTVALSGLGGDELFAGYDSFHMIPGLNRAEKILNVLPSYLRKQLGVVVSNLTSPSDKITKLVHLLRGKYSGANVYFLFRALFCEEKISSLISDPAIREAEILKNMDRTQQLIDAKPDLSPVNMISYLELTQYMTPTLLRDTDMMSMAHSLEVRVPLIDHKLVELMFSLPSNIKMEPGVPKPLLVKSLKRKLPDALVSRKKMGFTLPFENWIRGKLKSEIESVLLTPLEMMSPLISEAAIKKTWVDFQEKRCSWSRPWSLYVLKKWIERNL